MNQLQLRGVVKIHPGVRALGSAPVFFRKVEADAVKREQRHLTYALTALSVPARVGGGHYDSAVMS